MDKIKIIFITMTLLILGLNLVNNTSATKQLTQNIQATPTKQNPLCNQINNKLIRIKRIYLNYDKTNNLDDKKYLEHILRLNIKEKKTTKGRGMKVSKSAIDQGYRIYTKELRTDIKLNQCF